MKNFLIQNLPYISALFIIASNYTYIVALYKKEIRNPAVVSYILWTLIGLLLLVSSYQAGVRLDTTLLPLLIGAINPAITVILSLRYAKLSWTKTNTLSVLICLLAILFWKTTSSPLLGIIGGVAADLVAATPLLSKNWKDPLSEPLLPWILFTIGSATAVMTVKVWELEYFLFPIYMTLSGLLVITPSLHKRLRT